MCVKTGDGASFPQRLKPFRLSLRRIRMKILILGERMQTWDFGQWGRPLFGQGEGGTTAGSEAM